MTGVGLRPLELAVHGGAHEGGAIDAAFVIDDARVARRVFRIDRDG